MARSVRSRRLLLQFAAFVGCMTIVLLAESSTRGAADKKGCVRGCMMRTDMMLQTPTGLGFFRYEDPTCYFCADTDGHCYRITLEGQDPDFGRPCTSLTTATLWAQYGNGDDVCEQLDFGEGLVTGNQIGVFMEQNKTWCNLTMWSTEYGDHLESSEDPP